MARYDCGVAISVPSYVVTLTVYKRRLGLLYCREFDIGLADFSQHSEKLFSAAHTVKASPSIAALAHRLQVYNVSKSISKEELNDREHTVQGEAV